MATTTRYFELEVSLEDVEPRIWRRFLLRANATFHELHDTIQKACGWKDCHLYAFHSEGGRDSLAVSPYFEPWDGDEHASSATEVSITTIFRVPGDTCIYEYDFGDSWEHRVVLKAITRLPGTKRRVLLAGARAFPPEDCGAVPGYYECLEAFRITDEELARQDAEIQETLLSRREWFGDWNPERFDLEKTAREMRRPVRHPLHR